MCAFLFKLYSGSGSVDTGALYARQCMRTLPLIVATQENEPVRMQQRQE